MRAARPPLGRPRRPACRRGEAPAKCGNRVVVVTGVYTYDTVPFYFRLRGPGLLPDLPDPMVDMFIRDLTIGIPGTDGVRAAFLKCAIDEYGMTRDVERIMRAVARAHRATG